MLQVDTLRQMEELRAENCSSEGTGTCVSRRCWAARLALGRESGELLGPLHLGVCV